MPSSYLSTLHLEAPPSLGFFFLLRAFLGNSIVAFLVFLNVTCISSLILLTLAYALLDSPFGEQIDA